MKNLTKIHLVPILMGGLLLFSACVPKSNPRFVHEPREWVPSKTPQDLSVESKEFYDYDLAKAYESLGAPLLVDILETVLNPCLDLCLTGPILNLRSTFIDFPKS